MNFKFDDLIEENEVNSSDDEIKIKSKKHRSSNKYLPTIIVIVLSFLIGFVVFYISNSIYNKKPVEDTEMVQVNINDEVVQRLYSYVTYGTGGIRNEKFIIEEYVDIRAFTNMEKFYYALQFVKFDDFITENKVNSQNQILYYISNEKIKNYMVRFFGEDVTYKTDSLISYPFNFNVNGQNVGIMTYLGENNMFETVFYGVENKKANNSYRAKLVEASKDKNSTYYLKEKIIYTKIEKNNDTNTYNVSVYRDYNQTDLIETKNNLSEEEVNNTITVDNYLNEATEIVYKFEYNNGNNYFSSSYIVKSNEKSTK